MHRDGSFLLLDRNQKQILRLVEKQVNRKMAMKKGFRKKAKVPLEKGLRALFRRILASSNSRIKSYTGNSAFGRDELGRDVEDGLRSYIQLLKQRRIQLHTVIVLGSRAKGTWKPQSDIDVTIIADNLPNEGKNILTKRILGMHKSFILSDRPLYMGIEPSGCCSGEEFLKRLKQFDIQTLDAIFYGKVIYDDGFWATVAKEFEDVVKRYKLEQLPLKNLLNRV
jgi:hypothetical protein